MTTAAIREKLHSFVRNADDKKIKALYTLMENDMVEDEREWWEDQEFVNELDRRYAALESGEDKGYSWEEVKENARKSGHRKNSNV